MATDIVMPNLGFDAQAGRLVEWLKQPGDSVQKGEVLAIIESDKANVELESVAAGILLEHLHPAGEEVNVGTVIARVGQPQDAPPRPVTPPVEISPVARRMAAENQVDVSQISGSGRGGRIMREDVETFLKPSNGKTVLRALPKVRKLARESGLALATIPPSGKNGEITLADVQKYLPSTASEPEVARMVEKEGVQEIALSRLRRMIGKRLGKSKRKAPHFYVTGEFDLEAALGTLKKMPVPQPRLNDLVQYLTVQALQRVPELNATFEDKKLYHHAAIHLAVAVAREDGLITPVIAHAEKYSLVGLAAESRNLVQRTRENRLKPEDMQGGTFTISNLGVIPQVDHFTAVINPPQVAILAVGTVKQRPVVVEGGLFVRHTVHLTLSGDHRAVDGMHLARFMAAFQTELDYFTQR